MAHSAFLVHRHHGSTTCARPPVAARESVFVCTYPLHRLQPSRNVRDRLGFVNFVNFVPGPEETTIFPGKLL